MYFNVIQPNQLLESNSVFSKLDTLFVCDENTYIHCLNKIGVELPCVVIDPGEEGKNLNSVQKILSAMVNHQMTKSSVMVNVGGGVVCDVGGFAASIYQRGINFINIPTTLMAMADAAVGGKNGVNFGNLKNYVGTFQHPLHIYIGTDFLNTLPKQEFLSGFAEIIKHNILNQNTWEVLSINPNSISSSQIQKLISQSNTFKWNITQNDFNDTGIRKTLNFGHNLGHAIESLMFEKQIRTTHGEAIAAGMIMEMFISNRVLAFPTELLEMHTLYIGNIYPKLSLSKSDFNRLITLVGKDKKNYAGINHFSLLNKNGICEFDIPINEPLVLEALEYYFNLTF